MLNVLICDDEVKVCTLIKNLIDWEPLGMQLCGCAHAGGEALRLIEEHRPDIVITDIRMPDCDGLCLVRQVKEKNIDTHFIIISGYQHFEYAQTALRYGIVDYLLKPINKEELNNALEVTRGRICSEQEHRSSQDLLLASLDQSLIRIEEYQVHALLFQEPLIPLATLRGENPNLKFTSDTFNICIIRYDSPTSEHFVGPGIETSVAKTLQYIRTATPDVFTDFLCAPEENNIYCILNYSNRRKDEVKSYLDRLLYEARKFAGVFDGISVTVGVGRAAFRYEDLKSSCRTVLEAVHSRISCGTNRIIYHSHFNLSERPPELLNVQTIRDLCCQIDSCNPESFTLFLQDLFQSEALNASTIPWIHYQMALAVFDCFLRRAGENSYVELNPDQMRGDFLHRMEFVWNKPQLTGILTEVFEKYVREVEAKSENEADYPIRQAVCYIEEHYTGDCSLAAISDYVHMNPNYFSTFFKQKTGQNLNSYVAQYRMNMAKQMLRGSDDTIQEIAYRLTYSDVKHFRHLFKKYVGIAPMKFRELYR